MTERLHLHFSLSYIGEGNGNPLQCSCLENRDLFKKIRDTKGTFHADTLPSEPPNTLKGDPDLNSPHSLSQDTHTHTHTQTLFNTK